MNVFLDALHFIVVSAQRYVGATLVIPHVFPNCQTTQGFTVTSRRITLAKLWPNVLNLQVIASTKPTSQSNGTFWSDS